MGEDPGLPQPGLSPERPCREAPPAPPTPSTHLAPDELS